MPLMIRSLLALCAASAARALVQHVCLRPACAMSPVRLLGMSATEAPLKAATASRKKQERLHVRIDDVWYDLTNWRAAHPAGVHWIDAYQNRDATEVSFAGQHGPARTPAEG